MKKSLIYIGILLFIVIFFVAGMFFWPFVSYITGINVVFIPLLLFVLLLVMALFTMKKNKTLVSLVFGPLMICNFLEFVFCGFRYGSEFFINDVIITNIFSWSERTKEYYEREYVLANSIGLNILPSGVTIKHYSFINDKFVVCSLDGEEGLFSIEERRMVVPFGQTLARNGRPFRQGDYWGVQTYDGIVVIPAKYDLVIMEKEFIIIQKNGKYGCLNKMGRLSIPCEYSGWDKKTDKQGHHYCIFEDGYNYNNEGSDKYYIYESSDDFWGHLLVTTDKVCDVVTRDLFILRDSDYRCYKYYREEDRSSHDGIEMMDSCHYNYDENNNVVYYDDTELGREE